jgi:hypothetical protein
MNKVTLEMPLVASCLVNNCAYNISAKCHARAITIGDATHPGCDTFLDGVNHTRKAGLIAGIGACKMGSCKFNDDLECSAENIKVGMSGNMACCSTYARQ